MSPAKKKKGSEQEASSKLREAIVSKIQSGEVAGAEQEAPPAPPKGVAPAPAEPSVLRREIALFGPRLRDMSMFCRQLATLLDVGIPLLRSLKILSQRTKHPRLKRVVGEVADQVEQGNRLSSALAQHPKVFSPMFVNVAQIGEAGGILESSMKRLADVLESKASIRRRIVAACAYPAAAITVAIVIFVGIMVFAVPRFQAIYESPEIGELPRATQWVIGFSEFIRGYPLVYIPVILILIAAFYVVRRTAGGKRFFDWCRLRLPLLAAVNVKIAIARTTRTLGSLVAAGIPLLESLRITSQSSENVLVSESLLRVHDTVEGGGKLEEQLRQESHVFPPIVTDMIAIGDEAGALDTMLNKLADSFDEEVDSTLRGLTAIIEPALIVLLGLVVIFIACAFLLPYFKLAKAMQAL